MGSFFDILAANADGIRKEETFIQTCCGPASVLAGAVAEYQKAPFSAAPSMEKDVLDSLGKITKGIQDTHCQFGGDSDMVERWSGLAALVRAMLDKDDKKGDRSSAVKWFTDLCKSPEAANFIVEDFLQPGKPLFEEKTPVLFDKCDGRVLTLVVEANNGSRRCLVPNFWRIGLVPFPGRGTDGHLPTAIHEAMNKAMARDVPLRLRWHLEGFRSESLGEPLHGQSVESAAVCAVLAIVERYRDQQRPSDPQEKAVRRVSPILDASVAATGHVDFSGPLPSQWFICQVEKKNNSLQQKLNAAAAAGIDTICVAKDQPTDGLRIPDTLRLERVETVEQAYHILDNYQDILDRYREKIRSTWEGQWDEQPTETP